MVMRGLAPEVMGDEELRGGGGGRDVLGEEVEV